MDEKWSDFAYVLICTRLMWHKRKRRAKNDLKVWDLSNWKYGDVPRCEAKSKGEALLIFNVLRLRYPQNIQVEILSESEVAQFLRP